MAHNHENHKHNHTGSDSCSCHGGCSCGCGHDHSHGGGELRDLFLGGGLFVLGVILSFFTQSLFLLPVFVGAYLVLGRNILLEAGKSLFRGHMLDENFLMSIATLGAFAIGEYPEAVGVMLFFRIGEYFEERAVERSRSRILEAVDLRPETVNLVEGDGIRVIPASCAEVGQLLLVRPGDRIPLDGVVVRGESRLDTAAINGEPVPAAVRPGSPVLSGCVNMASQLVIRAEKPLETSMVTRILHSVENAAESKPKIDRFITRFARVYTPIVVLLALGTAVIPSLVDGRWNYWVYTALSFLVMSCPCALVLSVPLAYFSGIGVGSKRGILFKGGVAMEVMNRVRTVILDKTGTLTRGDFTVRRAEGDVEMLRLCASCEASSNHPIAASIVAFARQQGWELTQPDSLEEIAGRGISARIRDGEMLCGSRKLLEERGIPCPEDAEPGGTWVYLAFNGRFEGYFQIDDTLKPGAAAMVAQLRKRAITPVLLTGDREDNGEAVAKQVGITQFQAELLPHEKLEQLRRIRRERGNVMFVGDGINDAPVLAGADVGAAMGSGADAALDAADVVFMTSDVGAIVESLDIARRTNRIAMQNVVFALGIKALVMLLGLLGHASLWMAVFADSGVAMLCVLNSIRMLYRKK